MGTRAYVGFKYKGVYYLFYNQFDGYPSGLGEIFLQDLIEMIENGTIKPEWLKLMSQFKIVSDGTPTDAEKDQLLPFYDAGVSTQSMDDYYCLTRKLQYHFALPLQVGYAYGMEVSLGDGEVLNDYITDVDYTYVANADSNQVEFYTGKHSANYPFSNLPTYKDLNQKVKEWYE